MTNQQFLPCGHPVQCANGTTIINCAWCAGVAVHEQQYYSMLQTLRAMKRKKTPSSLTHKELIAETLWIDDLVRHALAKAEVKEAKT